MNIMSYIRNAKAQHEEKKHIRTLKNLQEETKSMELKAQREQQKAEINKLRQQEVSKFESARTVNAKFEKPNMLMSLGKGLATAIEKQKAVGKTNFKQAGTSRGVKHLQRAVSGSQGFGMTSSFGSNQTSQNVFSQSLSPVNHGTPRNVFDMQPKRKR
jgi:hypothetical protein